MKVIGLKNKCDLSDIVNSKFAKEKTEELEIKKDIPEVQNNNFIPMPDLSTTYFIEPIMTPEQAREKRKLIIHIKNYIKEFPNCLVEFKDINFTSKNIDELNNYLEEIKLTVCHSNSGGLMVGVFQGACDVLEKVAPIIRYDLTGLNNIACKNPNIINCVKEISLEYQNLNYISPDRRLALLMVQLCYALNSVNKTHNKANEKMEKTIPDNIVEKYVEL